MLKQHRLMTFCCVSFLVFLFCSNDKGEKLIGYWRVVGWTGQNFEIRQSGDAFFLVVNYVPGWGAGQGWGEGDKYTATYKNGILTISGPKGKTDALYITETDHLILDGNEYEKISSFQLTEEKFNKELMRANFLVEEQKFEEAKEIYLEILKNYPNKLETYSWLFFLYVKLRDLTSAEEILDSALDIFENNPNLNCADFTRKQTLGYFFSLQGMLHTAKVNLAKTDLERHLEIGQARLAFLGAIENASDVPSIKNSVEEFSKILDEY